MKNVPFELEVEDVIIPESCPIFNKPFEPVGSGPYSASLDRIIPSKGYVKGNIRVLSLLANQMKWNATQEELEAFCHGMLRLLGEENALVGRR